MTKQVQAKSWTLRQWIDGSRRSWPEPEFPSGPIALPSRWVFLGDSQTSGAAAIEEESAASPIVCFQNVWNENGLTPTTPTVTTNGLSGRTLAGTHTYYQGVSIASTPWVHTQESGGQGTGQTTPTAFGDTFEAYIEEIYSDWPEAIVTYETAFSFGREEESGRNWDPYNVELLARVDALAGNGYPVHVVDTDTYIKLLQAELTPADVWYQAGHPSNYHFTGVGNFLIAMLMLKALGRDITTLTHASVELDSGDKAAVIEVLS